MGNDFDFLSAIGVDWPEPVIPVEPPTLPVLEDDLACLQPAGHAADGLIRALEVDDLLQHVIGLGQAELSQLAAHEELLKNHTAADTQLQRVQEIEQFQAMGLSKTAAEFAAGVNPTPREIRTTGTPVRPARSKHRRVIDAMVARARAATGYSGDTWDSLATSMENFVLRHSA